MTILMLAAGAVACGLGTRVAAAAFVAAAVSAATGGSTAAIATWSAALAASCVLLVRVGTVRSLALPTLGTAAVVAAGSAPNAAVVLGVWVLGTAAAVLSAGDDDNARRWGLALCMSDVLMVAAIATTVRAGFEGWPTEFEMPAAAMLFASAILRAPLCAGASDEAPFGGLLIVRAQVAVLVFAAISAGGHPVAEAALVAGALGFVLAPAASSRRFVDGVQELSLFTLAVASTQLGWTTSGWAWGALATGTLTHQLRLISGRGTAGRWADALGRSAGLGLPFLPVVAALLEGALAPRGWRAAVLVPALLGGLAGRTHGPRARASRRRRTITEDARSVAVVAVAIAAALWAGATSLPRPPAGTAIAWPPAWAAAVVVGAGVAGSRLKGVVTTSNAAVAPRPSLPFADRLAQLRPPVPVPLLWSALGALASAAVAMWIVGMSRGFL